MNYTKQFKWMACVSALIILAGIIMGIVSGGMNVGVDFTGGTLVTMDLHADYDMRVVTDALQENNIQKAQTVRTGANAESQTMVDIRIPDINGQTDENALRVALLESIQKTYPQTEITTVDKVDGIASADLIRNAVLAIVIAGALILCYIWIRFELLFGVAAVIALLHDVAIMLALTCILRIPVNSPFIAAVLTIVGYSINNTIVIFDRIRENMKTNTEFGGDYDRLINASIKGTLRRSINTSFTTLITIAMLYVLGVASIREFALPIIIGLLAGTYSSIFLAGPMWGKWHLLAIKRKRKRA